MTGLSKILCCFAVLCLLVLGACSDERTRQLNRVSKDIIEASKNSKQSLKEGVASLRDMEMPEMPDSESFSKAGDAFVEKVSTATAEKVVEKMSSSVDSSTKEVSEAYRDTTRAVDSTKTAARSKIRWIARRTPRNQREANKMVHSYGQGWFLEFRQWMDSVAQKGTFRVDRRADERRAQKK